MRMEWRLLHPLLNHPTEANMAATDNPFDASEMAASDNPFAGLPLDILDTIFIFAEKSRGGAFSLKFLNKRTKLLLCSHLQVLTMSHQSALTSELYDLELCLKWYSRIREFSLSVDHEDLSSLVTVLGTANLTLESLKFHDQLHFPSLKSLTYLGKKIPNLVTFSFTHGKHLFNGDLLHIAEAFPRLENLDISTKRPGRGRITDAGIRELCDRLKCLCSINISGQCLLTRVSMEYLFVLPGLVSFVALNTDFVPIVSPLSFKRNLRELRLSKVNLTIDFVELLTNNPIKSLQIQRILSLEPEAIPRLQDLKLLSVAFKGSDVFNDAMILAISDYFGSPKEICFEDAVGNSVFERVINIQSLEYLQFKNTNIGADESMFRSLTTNFGISVLDLSASKQVSDHLLIQISQALPNIRNLNLSHCTQISSVGIRSVLKDCTKLIRLDIFACTHVVELLVEGEICLQYLVTPLCHCTWLQVIKEHLKSLNELKLSSNNVTYNVLIQFLEKNNAISRIHLPKTHIKLTPSMLTEIYRLAPRLRRISLACSSEMSKEYISNGNGCLVVFE